MTDTNSQKAPETNKQIRVNVNREKMTTCYSNAFQPLPSADEVMLDFGINHAKPKMGQQEEGAPAEFALDISHRIIMNYTTAKKLAMTLAQVLQTYEKEFGEVQINPEQRRTSAANSNANTGVNTDIDALL